MLEGARRHGHRAEHLRVAIAVDDLRRQRVGRKAELFADIFLDIWVDARVCADRAGDGADGNGFARLLQANLAALQRVRPHAEFHAESHGLCVDTMRAAHTQRLLEFEGATLADFAKFLHVGEDDVDSLRNLVAQRRIAQIGGGHAIVHPAARLLGPLGQVGIDILGHAGEESNDIMVGNGLDLVDALHREIGMRANPGSVFLRDARLTELGLRLACQNLDFLPDGELVLVGPDMPHLGAGIAWNHRSPFIALPVHPLWHNRALRMGSGCAPNARRRRYMKRKAVRTSGIISVGVATIMVSPGNTRVSSSTSCGMPSCTTAMGSASSG